MAGKNKSYSNHKIIASNNKARFNYFLEDAFEVGIILTGSEVKSLRLGKANLVDAYADEHDDEIFLNNLHISEYSGANRYNHKPNRQRKLLMHKNQSKKLIGKLKTKGITLVPTKIYFNEKGLVKLEIAIGKGKKLHDKRFTEKERDWNKEKSRMLKNQ